MQKNNTTTNKRQSQPEKPLNIAAKYSGIAIQMIAIISLGTWLGTLLDHYFETEQPYYTIAVSVFSIFVALYLVLKDFLKVDNNN